MSKVSYREFHYNETIIRGFLHSDNHKELVVIVHGFTGNKSDHHFMFKTIADEIVTCGKDVLRFDFLGSGDSDGSFLKLSIASQLKQTMYILNEMQKEYANIHLFGFSLGGVIASKVASEKTEIKSLFLLSPAGNFKDIVKKLLEGVPAYGDIYDYNGFGIHKNFVQEVSLYDFFENIARYQGQVKLVQGDCDQLVTMSTANEYLKHYQDVTFKIVQGADHCYASIEATKALLQEVRQFYGGM